MASYVCLIQFKDQGIRNIQDTVKRGDAAMAEAKKLGMKIVEEYASNYLIWSPITGEKAPDTVNDGKGPDHMTAKTDIIKYLKDSFAFGHKAVATLNASNLVEPITSSSGRPTTRLFLATFAPAHAFDHYGQIVEYLRMNGIVPPASRGQ